MSLQAPVFMCASMRNGHLDERVRLNSTCRIFVGLNSAVDSSLLTVLFFE